MAMEPLQNFYPTSMAPFVLGMAPDMRSPAMDVSRNAEGVVQFGTPVAQGTADRQCKAYGQASDKFLGVALMDNTRRHEHYEQYSTVNVRQVGPVVVQAGAAVAAGDKAYLDAIGQFTNVESGDVVGQFETSGSVGALVVLNLK